MAEYITVEGELGAVDVLTALTTFGGETPSRTVPKGRSQIVELWVACTLQVDTDTDRVGCILRLSGKGMVDGEQDFALASGYAEGAGAQAISQPSEIKAVELAVTELKDITIEVAAVGDDVARGHVEITLVFK